VPKYQNQIHDARETELYNRKLHYLHVTRLWYVQWEGHAACMNKMEMHKKFQSGKYDFGHLSVDWKITL